MYRRIELINSYKTTILNTGEVINEQYHYKGGLMGLSHEEVADIWFGGIDGTGPSLRGPDRSIPQNARFYFTEKGWAEIGRNIVAACQRVGQQYRIIRVKHNEVAVVWRDKHTGYEVAAQPRRKKRI